MAKTTRQESRVRSLARREGYVVRKSREWKNVPNLNNHSEYMLLDDETNWTVLGSNFDATLDEIQEWLRPSARPEDLPNPSKYLEKGV